MKRIFLFLVIVLSVLAACNDNTIESVQLDKPVLQLRVGEYSQLHAVVIPEDAFVSSLQWNSSQPEVASIVAGIVTAHKEGTTNITVEADGCSAVCLVVVAGDTLGNITPGEDVTGAVQYLPKSRKRGVSFNFTIEDDIHLLAPYISWSYNWGPDVTSLNNTLFNQYGLDFYPMAWNGNYDANRIRAYKSLNPQCEYILAFNEPNLTDQCNYTPQQAAEHWPALKALADELGMKIVAPAMNYGTLANYGDPIVWLDEFFTLVPLDDVDAIAIHCYMGSASALKSYVERFYKYDKPIWMTEFCAWEQHISNVQAQMNFMNEAIAYMEADPKVEKYAWFIPRTNGGLDSYPYMQLLTKTQPFQLSELGQVFAGLSSLDKSVWLSTQNYILPNTYSAVNSQESIGQDGLLSIPHLRPTTDSSGELQLADFSANQWVEYQIDAHKQLSVLRLRYASYADADLELYMDGAKVADMSFERTGDAAVWNTAEFPVEIPQGKHMVRVAVKSASIYINWFKFE